MTYNLITANFGDLFKIFRICFKLQIYLVIELLINEIKIDNIESNFLLN